MTRPVPSTNVEMNGAETTAGSIPNLRKTSGKTDATVADQIVISKIATDTTTPTFHPTDSSCARPNATNAMINPRMTPTDISLTSTQPTSRNRTSLTAIARTSVVVTWLPTLPPVPISSGMK